MAFVKKLLDILNVGNIKEGENRISEYSNIKNSGFENQKERVLDFLQLKIEEANKLYHTKRYKGTTTRLVPGFPS